MTNYFKDHYKSAQRSGLQGWGNSFVDRQVERLAVRAEGASVLEIGVSSGEHFQFVDQSCPIATYVGLDLSPGNTDPVTAASLARDGSLVFVAGNAEQLPFRDKTFDLVISTCVLAHVTYPDKVFAELRRVVKIGGTVVVGMPCDPGAINRLIKSLVTYRAMRRAGVKSPRMSYALEHRNSIGNLVEIAKHTFAADKLKLRYFPLRLRSWNFNLVVTLQTRRLS